MGWHIEGEYIETCNCAFLCPCIVSNSTAEPTEGDCKAAMAMRIDTGEKDGVSLAGTGFIILLYSPGVMADGNFKVGLIVDANASDAQAQAITEIASGAEGGPMAAFQPLIAEFAGVERRPITFDIDGLNRSVSAGDLFEQAVAGVESMTKPGEAIVVDNAFHPASTRLALAKAVRSVFNVFGIQWTDNSGQRNGHFAPFAWAG